MKKKAACAGTREQHMNASQCLDIYESTLSREMIAEAVAATSRPEFAAEARARAGERLAAARAEIQKYAADAIGSPRSDGGEECFVDVQSGGLLVNAGGVSYIIVSGAICYRADWMYWCCGGVLQSDLIAAIDAATGAPTSRIVLVIDSPGGSSTGMPEVCDAVRRAKAAKPITAIGMGLMCSAAYGLACLANEVVATSSAIVGSIGSLFCADLIDDTEALKMAGIGRTRIMLPGKLKSPNPGPMDEEIIQQHFKLLAECAYEPFRARVVEGRGDKGLTADVIDGFKGAAFGTPSALANGLIDRVVSPAEFVQELTSNAQAGGSDAEDTHRPGVSSMATDKGPANGPANDVLKNLTLADLSVARPDLIQDAIKSGMDAAVQAAINAPASPQQLKEICGDDTDTFSKCVLGTASVNTARQMVLDKTRGELAEARTKIENIEKVREKGGGGGTSPVGGSGGQANTSSSAFVNLAHAAMSANPKLSFDAACYQVALVPANRAAHKEWVDAGCPSK